MIKMLFSSCFCQNNIQKAHEIVKVAVINDNNNFAPSLFRSLCEFVGDCFGPRYFSSGAALPQKNTSVQNNHLRFHTMTSKMMVRSYYCLISIHRKFKDGNSSSTWEGEVISHRRSVKISFKFEFSGNFPFL